MVRLAVESEKALTARECGTQQREQLRPLSQPRSSSGMELSGASSTVALQKTPPPAATSMARIDKENLSLADKMRSPALDTSLSKDQWRTIAIQAAARANGDIYEEWREPLPMTALHLQHEGSGKVAGTIAALTSHSPTSHSQADICSSGPSSAGYAAQSAHSSDANTTSAKDCRPEDIRRKKEVPPTTRNEQQLVAEHCTAPTSIHAGTAGATCSAEEPAQDQPMVPGAPAEVSSASRAEKETAPSIFISSESAPKLTVSLGEEPKAASCSPATDNTSAEDQTEPPVTAMSQAVITSSTAEGTEASAADPASTGRLLPLGEPPVIRESSANLRDDPKADISKSAASIPAPCLNLHDSGVEAELDSMPPAHRRQLSGLSSNGASSAQRQLSGESSKGSVLSGNPYASSCGDSRAGSMGGSPAGSLEAPESSQAHLQHELSGNPFAPPGTLRSRPVSPLSEPAPCHGRSLSLQVPDLPLPTSAALAVYSTSLSLPYASHTAVTGAQLYQMQQSPMPEDGETFRPAKDILQELFLERATRPPVTGSTAASLDGAVGVGGEAETVNSSSVCGGQQPAQARNTGQQRLSAGEPEHQQAAAEESDEAPDHGGGNLPDKAQSWEPTWGLASSEGPPAAAISGPFPESGSKADPQQQVQGTAQSAWEAAWEGSLAPGVPDQAASSASAQPVLDAAWDPDWGSSHAIATSAPPQQEIMLLLPSREPPPPPAMTGAQSVAQHNRSAAQRECALPVMRPEDRQKCERFYKQQGFTDKGGVSNSEAQPLHAKSGCRVAFEAIWQLVSPDAVSASLDCSSFCLFMHLLKTSMKGIQLPASISTEQARDVLGPSSDVDTASAGSQQAAPAVTQEAAGSAVQAEVERPRHAHARGFSYFQPFQSGLQQGALSRRPSTADSPNRQPQLRARPGAPPSLTRPGSAASESSVSHLSPGVSPCGALVAKAVREANREGTGQVWQPLASRQLDSWAHTSAPAHALSEPAPQSLAPQGQLRRQLTEIPSPRRACPTLPSPRSSDWSPNSHPGARTRRSSHVPARGSERVNITVNGAKVEYSKSLDRPFFSLSLHDAAGKRLEAVQDTPPGHFDRRTFIITAGHDLQFSTPMQQIPPESVVYIEVKHWKPASKKMSTLGWSFAPIEMFIDTSSENTAVRAGQLFLHLYKKPLSYTAHARNGQLKQLRSKGHDLYLTLR